MKILLTGANGYIGKRILLSLLQQGHEVVCCVRNSQRFQNNFGNESGQVSVIEIDFLNIQPENQFPADIDAAYYLIHSMSEDAKEFEKLEAKTAHNFVSLLAKTRARQVIYLSGIVNEEKLSKHLASRKNVETILNAGPVPLTTLRAGIIVGSGSSSFEIIRDLVEKLPVMIAPKWLHTRTQPIAIRNILEFLTGVLLLEETFNRSYDIGGPDVLSYKDMLLRFAKVRGLKRRIFIVPVMTPRLSSYWLYFITRTSYKLAVNLVNSMKVEVVAKENDLAEKLNIRLIPYDEAVGLAFQKIEQNNVVSSWKDALVASYQKDTLLEHIRVPTNGCFVDKKSLAIKGDHEKVLDNIWSIGGDRGWYYGNALWKIRGFIDKLFGGVGLRRGRTNKNSIYAGDTLDFWRVLIADKKNRRLLLYAEMKLPGEAWLEFKIHEADQEYYLEQTATFRPKGLLGRLYWFAVLPFHGLVFKGMIRNIVDFR